MKTHHAVAKGSWTGAVQRLGQGAAPSKNSVPCSPPNEVYDKE